MDKSKDPLVSICCITYNHENFIRDAIDGFLMQKTDFSFEIIVHDDASSDRTADIVREYERMYPDIIKPIYQTENQYSKGEQVTLFALKAAKGKYIALCEGDDYWTDPLKLQKQITEMEKHPDCYISFHPAVLKKVDGSKNDGILGLHSDETTIFPTEKVILGGGGFMPTAAIILNRLAIPRIISFFGIAKDTPIGDYYIQVLGAENGGALYLNDVMSVYRSGVPGSWSKMRESSNCRDSWLIPLIKCDEKLNTYTHNKFSKSFEIRQKRSYSQVIRSFCLDMNTKKNVIDANLNKIDLKDHILWNVIYKNPFIVNILCSVRKFLLRILSFNTQ